MISFIQPSPKDILALQDIERSYYWSVCAELILKKQGITCAPHNVSGNGIHNASGSFDIALRNTGRIPAVGFCEGPFEHDLLARLNLHAETASLAQVSLQSAARKPIGSLAYGRFLVKKIPSSRAEITIPHEYIEEDPKWAARDIKFQYFQETPDDWKTLAHADLGEGDQVPVVIARDALILCGIPIFDVFGFNHAMPALSEGFYKSVLATYQYPVERWLTSQLVEHANLRGVSLEQKALWPKGWHTALTIRHDYDRPISRQQLDDMLRFYAERNIRATWFLLVGKPPPPDQINAMLALGHEVALHTISPSLDVFLEEAVRFREITGMAAAGFSCHGGIGSRGHLALTHNQWALHAGMRYGEMIGRCRGVPHPVVFTKRGVPEFGKLVVQNCHHSLDLNTKPDGHQLERLRLDVPKALEEGGHVTIMNHPDIHWQELMTLLDGLALDGVWCATISEVVERLNIHAYS
jgi:hypothetical protein